MQSLSKSFALNMQLVGAKAIEALSLAYRSHQPESKDAMTRDLQQLHSQLISTIIGIIHNLADAERRKDAEDAEDAEGATGAKRYGDGEVDAALSTCIAALCEVSLHAGKKGPVADTMSHDDGFGSVCKTLLDMRRLPHTAFECMTFMVRHVKAVPEYADKLIVGSASKAAIAMMTHYQERHQTNSPMNEGILQSLGSKVLQLMSLDDRNVKNMVAEGALVVLTGALTVLKSTDDTGANTVDNTAPAENVGTVDAALTVADSEIARAATSCLLRMLICDPTLGGDGTEAGQGAMMKGGCVEAVISTVKTHVDPGWAEHTELGCRLLKLMLAGEHGPLAPMAALQQVSVLQAIVSTLGNGVCEPKPHIQACKLLGVFAMAMTKALDEAEEGEGKVGEGKVSADTLTASAAKWAADAKGAATGVVRGFMRAYGPDGSPKRAEVLQASVASVEKLGTYMAALEAHPASPAEAKLEAKAVWKTCQSAATECKEFSAK
jgi:hypothetical protein